MCTKGSLPGLIILVVGWNPLLFVYWWWYKIQHEPEELNIISHYISGLVPPDLNHGIDCLHVFIYRVDTSNSCCSHSLRLGETSSYPKAPSEVRDPYRILRGSCRRGGWRGTLALEENPPLLQLKVSTSGMNAKFLASHR